LRRAKELGYQKNVLDTLPSMNSAIKLYKDFGFEEIEAYYETPIEGTIFLGLELVGDWDWLLKSL
jgi:ribosomal protein S18 acetylase RimI-like enzyme